MSAVDRAGSGERAWADRGVHRAAVYCDGYAVFRGALRLTDELTYMQARARAGELNKQDETASRTVRRPCLCCGAPFQSEGPHNRMCNPCRAQRSSGLADSPYEVAPRRGTPRRSGR